MTTLEHKDPVFLRSTEKGTATIKGSAPPAEFMGDQNRKNLEERLALAGDIWIMSAKGTKKIKLSEMREPKKIDHKGQYISTGKGTGKVRI